MKKMKKIVALLLAAVMALGMSMTVFASSGSIPAANAGTTTGTIEINNANVGETYTGYKIFDVTYSGTNYSYTIDSANAKIFGLVDNYTYNGKDVFLLEQQDATTTYTVSVNAEAAFDTEAAAKDFAAYLAAELEVLPVPTKEIDGTTYKVLTVADVNGASYVDLTSSANDGYMVQNNITEEVYGNQTNIYWNNLSLGYWFVKTSVGTLCVLDTTNNEVRISDKNPDTTIDKTVQEDTTGIWGDSNTAEIGDTVEFKTLIKAQVGAKNYKLYDKMTEGLTFNKDIVIYIDSDKDGELDYTDVNANNMFDGGDTVLEEVVDTSNYTVEYNVAVIEGATTYECDFVISFNQDYLDSLSAETYLLVSYSAVLNDKAIIAENVGSATNVNLNDTKLEWGNATTTEWDTTKTYTLYFDLIKTDSDSNYLMGAQFELYYDAQCTNKVPLRSLGSNTYKVASEAWQDADQIDGKFVSAVIHASHAEISGLDANTTYYLKEIAAPDGYNVIDGAIPVQIGVNSLATTFDPANNTKYNPYVDAATPGDGGVQVINKTGTELPSTGGIGTTIFYVVGGALVLTAVVVLVSRKRMSVEE